VPGTLDFPPLPTLRSSLGSFPLDGVCFTSTTLSNDGLQTISSTTHLVYSNPSYKVVLKMNPLPTLLEIW